MAEKRPARKGTQKPTSGAAAIGKTSTGFTDDERAAMREHAQELKAAAGRGSPAGSVDDERAVRAKIAEMPEPDRAMGERIHAIIDKAILDDGDMWPTAFALRTLTSAEEARIAALVKKAVR